MCLNIKFGQLLFILCFCTFAASVIAQETQKETGKKIQLKKLSSENQTINQAELKTPGINNGSTLQFTVIEDDIMKTSGEGENNEDGGVVGNKGKVEVIKSITSNDRNLSERLSKSIQVYPVPAMDFVNVAIQENRVATISLTNSLGQIIYTENEPESVTRLNISNLAQGVYYILITTEDKTSAVKSIVKQ